MSLEYLLRHSLSSDTTTRIRAELALRDVAAFDLLSVVHSNQDSSLRLSAMIWLKNYILHHWSAQFETFRGDLKAGDDKARLRQEFLRLIGDADRAVRLQAGYIISRIVVSDFPDEWPELLSQLMSLLQNPPTEETLHGALVVMKGKSINIASILI